VALTLTWTDEQDEYSISHELIARLEELLRLAGSAEQVKDGEVALTFVDDEAIRELNKQYRGIDKPTDVLSFSMLEMTEDELTIVFGDEEFADDDFAPDAGHDEAEDEDEEEGESYEEPLGDIVISVPRAIAQAQEYGHSIERELGFLFVHGFLHLIGYDHNTEEEEKAMFSRQEDILQQAGLTR
jgi:probable rRNA maturation factor